MNKRTLDILPRSFYGAAAPHVARQLLGKLLVHREASGTVTSGIIVETEAYLGAGDLAAHSAAGITPRTRVIFGPPGHAYIYLNYGIHECLNIVAEPEGSAGCVLIRALHPVEGLDCMRARRKGAADLAGGPGKLTQAMGITRSLNGTDMTRGALTVQNAESRFAVAVTKRIGIIKSPDLLLRFLAVSSDGNGSVAARKLR